MTIEKIDETRLVIVLCSEDMDVFSIDYNTISFVNPYSRKILRNLLSLAGSKTGIDVHKKKLVIEAMPHDDGCIFIVTVLPKENQKRKKYKIKKADTSILYTFENLDDFLTCSEILYNQGFGFFKSDLYLDNDVYSLIIKTKKAMSFKANAILSEFSNSKVKDATTIAKVEERAEIITKDFAIIFIGGALALHGS